LNESWNSSTFYYSYLTRLLYHQLQTKQPKIIRLK
jgi:hypothetical protein